MPAALGARAMSVAMRHRNLAIDRPEAASPALTWIGDERIAIGGVPPARTVAWRLSRA